MHAAHANAETAKVPAVHIAEETPRSKAHVGFMVAAGVVVIGAAALTIGVMSGQGSPRDTGQRLDVAAAAPSDVNALSELTSGSTEITVDASTEGEDLLTARVHAEVASSLPRIQAVTAAGMREGSGLFVTDDGHIATSAGLIDNADYVLVWTDDDQRWKAHVVATDPVSDIAVIQIDSEDWPAAGLGDSTGLWDGQFALVLDHEADSISLGEVTGVTAPFVEIDQPAALPGSGVVDDTGAVIAMVNSDGTNRHATPGWMLEQVVVDLISAGSTTHLWLGVIVTNTPDGDMVMVSDVLADSPASEAGLRAGDLIDSINNKPVVDAASLHRLVQDSEPGSEAVIAVTRNNSRSLIVATFAELPD